MSIGRSFYRARSSKQIEEFVETVLLGGKDARCDERQEVLSEEVLVRGYDASGFIKEYVDEQLSASDAGFYRTTVDS